MPPVCLPPRMVDAVTAGRLLAGVVLLLGNGYFVTIEFAMTRVRQFDASEFVESGSRGLERAWEMTERLEIYLSGCQLGITICSVGLGVAAEPALATVVSPLLGAFGLAAGRAGHGALSVVLALAVINLLHLVVGEQAPTYLGIERTKTIAKYGAPVLYWWTRVLGPVIRLADWIAKALLSVFGVAITRSWAEEELEEDEARPEGRAAAMRRMGGILSRMGLPEERQAEVINALAIDQIEVEDIMVDREEVVAVRTTDSPEENFDRMAGTPHTRFPLVGESFSDVRGVVYVPALLEEREALEAGETTFEEVAAPPMVVGPDLPVSELIDRFQDEQQELALVVDDGEVVGLVTATDAFEEITGELQDPLDAEADTPAVQ